jgi:nucleoside-diphosphate-sugar epimerase
MRVFLAGASGAVGIRLVPLLTMAGYQVVGSTRSPQKVDALQAAGASAIVVDVFDAPALTEALRTAQPAIVVSQLTDLPLGLDALEPDARAEAVARNARIRVEGTRDLVDAARTAGASRLIVQSIAWVYASGPEPHDEDDPLDLGAEGTRAVTVGGVVEVERLALESPPLVGTVLRYGQLYGPDTGRDDPSGSCPVHVDAAASAALLAIQRNRSGIFNVAEDNGHVSTARARRELGWDPAFRY